MRNQLLLLQFLLIFTACQSGPSIKEAMSIVDTLKKEVAPDKRVANFDIQVQPQRDKIKLTGTTNLPKAKEELFTRLNTAGFETVDEIKTFPTKALGEKKYGVVNVSVCNIRSKKGHSQELTTQALLGTPIKILDKEDSWFKIQTPDGYIAWLDEGGFTWMDEDAYKEWIGASKVMYLNDFGFSYDQPNSKSTRVSDLTSGNLLKTIGTQKGFIQVQYPDQRIAFIPEKEVINYDTWLATRSPNADNIIATAKTFLGRPYVWGGTSGKGVDCSGFTKMVFYLNGIQIARDASQQVHSGVEINAGNNFDNLKAGDLLFFGRAATPEKKERISHVGIYLGNGEFIHSSGDAGVKIESLFSDASNYADNRRKTFIRAKRMLISLGRNGVDLLQNLPTYNSALL